MRVCINWKVVGGLAVVAVAVWLVAPSVVGAAVPVLVFAACPLSMLVMMRGMAGGRRHENRSAGATCASGAEPGELTRLRAEVARLHAERDTERGDVERGERV